MPKKEITFNAGDVLFKKGEPCDFVYTIVDGTAEEFYEIRGKARPLKEENAGAVLGKGGALDGFYDTNVRAKRKLVVTQMTRDEYISELQKTGEMTPSSAPAGESFSDDGDFNFDFNSTETEMKPDPKSVGRDRFKRGGAIARRQPQKPLETEDFSEDSGFDSFSFDEEKTPVKKKNELVKVERSVQKQPLVKKTQTVLVNEKPSGLKEWLNEAKKETPVYGTCFLFAAIDGDADNKVGHAVCAALNEIPNAHVKFTDTPVTETNQHRAVLQMRAWLKKFNADAGLYAQFDAAGRVLEFHTVRAADGGEEFGGARFFLPADLTPETSDLLRIFMVCALTPKRLEHEQLLSLYLPEMLKKSFETGSKPLVGLNNEEQSADLCCFADALSLANIYAADDSLTVNPQEIYEHSLSLMPSYAPEFVFVNRQLGLMNQIEGEKNNNPDVLKRAENLFESALKCVSKKRQTAQWGDLKFRLGAVRSRFAEISGKGDDFATAVNTYREALSVLKPSEDLEKWADSVNGLARTVFLSGMYSNKTALLERAVSIYEKELHILDRERTPRQFAAASNNLASVLFVLSDRKNDTALLKRAVEAFSDALAMYDKIGSSKNVVVTQVNLNKAKKTLEKTQKEAEKRQSWLDDLEDELQDETADDSLHFEKIAVFEELPDDET